MNLGFTQMDLTSTSSQNDASTTNLRAKPELPRKPVLDSEGNPTTHVRDMVRKLQGEDRRSSSGPKPPGKPHPKPRPLAPKEDMGGQASKQTLEDLKAIDEDIEKLRKQIEERDKIISALREAAEAKDKKLDSLMDQFSKLQVGGNGKDFLLEGCERSRATAASPSSPPLCSGDPCWADSFVSENYHEPVYAQLLNDHAALQKIYDDLRAKLEAKGKEFERLKAETEAETRTNGEGTAPGAHEKSINVVMAEQIRVLKEREAQLMWEAEELREQNDLMEFRILELEESRKEFLDKEMSVRKEQPGKMVWRERDLEEVSDSGVVSLPTSDDLTSDSELGEAIRNYSPLGAITNLNLLNLENFPSESGINDCKGKKSSKSAECLQESGIFVDSEVTECAIQTSTFGGLPSKHSKACQTESLVDKTLLDLIDSSCDLFFSKNFRQKCLNQKSDDLSTEISKLSVIQKRIQQKKTSPVPIGPHTIFTCPYTNSVVFYEERLSQLEDKLKIYESSGETKDVLLAKRLQKEIELAHQVKELTDKVSSLEANNRRLEEEKCEFEEAENDTRFQCQRLELRLQELLEKNTELELQVERHRLIMTEERQKKEKRKNSLEGLINRYERRNFELEEKEVEARQKLSIIEAAMPAVIAWNVFKMSQNPDFTSLVSPSTENMTSDKERNYPDSAVNEKLDQLLDDQKKLRKEYEKVEESASDREKALRDKIEKLEAKAVKDREVLEEMTNALKSMKLEEKGGSLSSIRSDEVDLFEELKQMVANEIQLRVEIERLQKKEEAYMISLEKADEVWAGMEEDYKRRLKEAEETNQDLQKRIVGLEQTQAKLEKSLAEQTVLRDNFQGNKDEIEAKIQELIWNNEILKKEISQNLEMKFLEQKRFLEKENAALKIELKKMKSEFLEEEKKYVELQRELQTTREELQRERTFSEGLRLEVEGKSRSVSSMEIGLQSQITDLTQQLSQKSKELSNLEVTVAELREEVETLEGKVAELVETIHTIVSNQEGSSEKKKDMPQWTLPVQTPVRQIVSYNLHSIEDTISPAQVEAKKKRESPSLEVLIPSPPFFFPPVVDFPLPVASQQTMKFVFPVQPPARCVLMKHDVSTAETYVVLVSKQLPRWETESAKDYRAVKKVAPGKDATPSPDFVHKGTLDKETSPRAPLEDITILRRNILSEDSPTVRRVTFSETVASDMNPPESEFELDPAKEEEIIQLSIKNTELMQILEKMEEDSKLKDKELEELQKIVKEIREEQIALQSLFQDHNSEVKLREEKKDSDAAPEKATTGNPPEEDAQQINNPVVVKTSETVPALFSEPQLQNSAEQEAPHIPAQPRSSAPKFLGKSSSASLSVILSKTSSLKETEVAPDFFSVAPIKTVRRIGDDSVFLEWDNSNLPDSVVGFEIKVNGLLQHRVRSSTRNKALLHPLNFKDKISIQLFVVSEFGRSVNNSAVSIPDDEVAASVINKSHD